MSQVSVKSVARYIAMPEIIPRVRRIFASGFGMIAYLIAQVYYMVRILPNNHVYLDPANIGRFGIRHVIAEAVENIEFKANQWDKIAIFGVIASGLMMMVLQLGLIVFSIFFEPVWANTNALPETNLLFQTPDPLSPPKEGEALVLKDIAFILLDRVFGVPNFFCSVGEICTDVFVNDQPWPFHLALHEMFKFYSQGMLVVAVLIFLYFIVVVVGETAISGTPFGERFQNMWVPLRMVFALLLLTPIAYGLNTGQYIVLYVAKVGSSFATNGWHKFNYQIQKRLGEDEAATPTGESVDKLIGVPSAPDITPIIQSMALIHACSIGEWYLFKDNNRNQVNATNSFKTQAEFDSQSTAPPERLTQGQAGGNISNIMPYFYRPGSKKSEALNLISDSTTFGEAVDWSNHSDIIIKFGRVNLKDNVPVSPSKPECGEMRIPITDRGYLFDATNAPSKAYDANIDEKGPAGAYMHRFYYKLILNMWFGEKPSSEKNEKTAAPLGGHPHVNGNTLRHLAHRFILKGIDDIHGKSAQKGLQCVVGCDNELLPSCTDEVDVYNKKTKQNVKELACAAHEPTKEILHRVSHFYREPMRARIREARELGLAEKGRHAINRDMLDLGWGGAGAWFNRISRLNGTFVEATSAVPQMVMFPHLMEEVRKIREANDKNVVGWQVYNIDLGGDKDISDKLPAELRDHTRFAQRMYEFMVYMLAGRASYGTLATQAGSDGNVFRDAINFIFGTEGVFQMRDSINQGIHPIAQLSIVGKGMIDSTITNIGISTGLSVAGGLIESFSNVSTQKFVTMANSLFSTTAFIGLTAGVTLYYIIPILPFVYFFFALTGWVKGIFEAMVGVPLWALAHLRIDGEGLPGQAAESGYFLLLEILIRPILIVFGLVAAMLIFGMQARLLDIVWDIVLDSVGGSNRGSGSVIKASAEGLDEYVNINRGTIDEFFYTIIYTLIIYMMAMASFKLVDAIPDSIMRWSGVGTSAFGEMDKNPSAQLISMTATSGMVQGQRVVQSGQSALSGLGKLVLPKRGE